MALTGSDIEYVEPAGGFLGGAIGTTVITSGVSGNIFNTFTGDETSAGGTFYHCVYIRNASVTNDALSSKIWINSETVHAGVNVEIGLGSSAINGTEQTIADENTAPTSVTFSDAATEGAALVIGDLPQNDGHKAIWFKVTIDPATSAKNVYDTQVTFKADTTE